MLESSLRWRGGTYIFALLGVLGVIACGVLFIATTRGLLPGSTELQPATQNTPPLANQIEETVLSDATSTLAVQLETNTPFPTPILNTVTPVPAPTETPGPCQQTVLPGDDMISLVFRCGHRNLDVIDLVLELNDLENANLIQANQVLEIPWPTPTIDQNLAPDTPTSDDMDNEESQTGAQIASSDSDSPQTQERSGVAVSEELPPGIIWHHIVAGEDISGIAFRYDANVEILSQLNPEITFSQCDFGIATGGPNCIVQIFEGQLLRVPGPTPSPTLQPTPSGSETPTPTATPTINVPSATSPENRAFFQSDERVTLRWVTTGTLGTDEFYRIQVRNEATGFEFSGDTTELFYIIPETWHEVGDTRYQYTWTVSVIHANDPENPRFIAQRQSFFWQGRSESEC